MRSIEIDGSRGEGGGQILRTSLALSIITGRPLRMQQHPRGPREARACSASTSRASRRRRSCAARRCTAPSVGSQDLEFTPGADWRRASSTIDIGTAGSTTLVVQTILVPAIVERQRRCTRRITGGTHNPMAPPFEFLDRVFLPHLRAMGADVTLTLERHGFVPERRRRASTLDRAARREAAADRDRRGRAASSRARATRDLRAAADARRRARARRRAGAARQPGAASSLEVRKAGPAQRAS